MLFDVYINGRLAGTFGHEHSENLSVSVAGTVEGNYLFAGVVCRENGKLFHQSWDQLELGQTDEVRIVASDRNAPTQPAKKFEMGRTDRKAWEANVCEFCQRNETQVPKFIPGDAHRPGICSDCVELCNAIIAGKT